MVWFGSKKRVTVEGRFGGRESEVAGQAGWGLSRLLVNFVHTTNGVLCLINRFEFNIIF